MNRMATLLALSALPTLGHAAQCDGNGQLRYLGNSAEGDRSVWLSSTSAGTFRLDAAQGNQTVDTWSKGQRGLRVSLSPVVSSGNGGTHKLYANGNCILDAQNQKDGFVFPPGITRPPSFRPLIPITPTVPALPALPDGVTPPIGTLPPETLTPMMPSKPSLPGGVTPPIGTLPPETLTPTMPSKPSLPGGVTPPIGTLPPETLTPTVPTVPSLPGGVTPPIGTLPPETLTPMMPSKPSLPGGVTPPIGTLPPETLTPTMPSKPSLPGGVTPPIGTLPPETLTPTMPSKPSLPGGVTPPIGTLPETPTTGPGKAQGELGGAAIAAPQNLPCRGQRPDDPAQAGQLSDCYIPAPELQSAELPLTPGRELVAKSEWNIWMDGSATRLRDTRDGMDTHGNSSSFSLGIDRVVNDDLVAGLQLSVSRGKSSSFGDTLRTDATGYSIGPYISYSFSPNWLLYGALGFGRQTTDTQLVSLSGTSDSEQYSLSLQAEGQYALGSVFIRPKVQLSQTHNAGDSYQLKGVILNTPLTLNMRKESFNYGVVQGSVELNRTFDLGNNRVVMPFVEAGIYYEYLRPNSGQHLTGDLTYADSSPWGGVLRLGARSLIGNATMASLDIANQTIGVTDVNIWEARLLISHSF